MEPLFALALFAVVVAGAVLFSIHRTDIRRLKVCDHQSWQLFCKHEQLIERQADELAKLEKRHEYLRKDVAKLEALLAREALSRHAADEALTTAITAINSLK